MYNGGHYPMHSSRTKGAYKPSYLDIDIALSRYYETFGKSYKGQFATFCEDNRCTKRVDDLIFNNAHVLAANFCTIPFRTEPPHRAKATAALFQSIYRDPFCDFSLQQTVQTVPTVPTVQTVHRPTSKRWICSECSSWNDLLSSFQCTTCFSPYEAATALVRMDTNHTLKSVPSPHRVSPRNFYEDSDSISSIVHGLVMRSVPYLEHRFDDHVLSLLCQFCDSVFRWHPAAKDRDHFEISWDDQGASILRRKDHAFTASNVWRNCLGNEVVGLTMQYRRFTWTLQYGTTYLKQTLIVGVVGEEGAGLVMNGHFAQYTDGHGVWMKFGGSEDDANDRECWPGVRWKKPFTVTLRWVQGGGEWKCQFLVGDQVHFELPSDKRYMLAVATNNSGAQLKCIAFERHEHAVDGQT